MTGILSIFITGLSLLFFLEKNTRTSLSFASLMILTFPVGCIGIAAYLSTLSILGISWHQPFIIFIPWVISSVILYFYRQRLLSVMFMVKQFLTHWTISKILFFITLLLISSIIAYSQLTHSFLHADAITFWFMKATLFFRDGGIVGKTFSEPSFSTVPLDPKTGELHGFTFLRTNYPPFVPLLISWVFLNAGIQHFILAKWLWLISELILVCLLFYSSKLLFNHFKAGFIAVLLWYGIPSTINHLGFHSFGFADIWVGLFALLTVWSCYQWLQKKDLLWRILTLLFITVTALIKIEAIVIVLLLPLLWTKPLAIKNAILQIAVGIMALLPIVLWYWFSSAHQSPFSYESHIQESISFQTLIQGRLGAAVLQVLNELLEFKKYFLFPVFFLISFATLLYYKLKQWKIIWLNIIPFAAIGFLTLHYSLSYTFTLDDIVTSSFARYFLEWSPVMVFLTLLNISLTPLLIQQTKNVKAHK